VFFNADIAFG